MRRTGGREERQWWGWEIVTVNCLRVSTVNEDEVIQ